MTKREKLKQAIENAKKNADQFKDKNLKTFWQNASSAFQGKFSRATEKELSQEEKQ